MDTLINQSLSELLEHVRQPSPVDEASVRNALLGVPADTQWKGTRRVDKPAKAAATTDTTTTPAAVPSADTPAKAAAAAAPASKKATGKARSKTPGEDAGKRLESDIRSGVEKDILPLFPEHSFARVDMNPTGEQLSIKVATPNMAVVSVNLAKVHDTFMGIIRGALQRALGANAETDLFTPRRGLYSPKSAEAMSPLGLYYSPRVLTGNNHLPAGARADRATTSWEITAYLLLTHVAKAATSEGVEVTEAKGSKKTKPPSPAADAEAKLEDYVAELVQLVCDKLGCEDDDDIDAAVELVVGVVSQLAEDGTIPPYPQGETEDDDPDPVAVATWLATAQQVQLGAYVTQAVDTMLAEFAEEDAADWDAEEWE